MYALAEGVCKRPERRPTSHRARNVLRWCVGGGILGSDLESRSMLRWCSGKSKFTFGIAKNQDGMRIYRFFLRPGSRKSLEYRITSYIYFCRGCSLRGNNYAPTNFRAPHTLHNEHLSGEAGCIHSRAKDHDRADGAFNTSNLPNQRQVA